MTRPSAKARAIAEAFSRDHYELPEAAQRWLATLIDAHLADVREAAAGIRVHLGEMSDGYAYLRDNDQSRVALRALLNSLASLTPEEPK